jgi:DNA-binding XRE family transcriptional regulator
MRAPEQEEGAHVYMPLIAAPTIDVNPGFRGRVDGQRDSAPACHDARDPIGSVTRGSSIGHVYMGMQGCPPRQAEDMPDSASSDTWIEYTAALGVALARARARRGLSQERVAHAAGLSTFTYRKLEKGESNPGTPANPRLRTIASLAEVLGLPLAELLPPDPGGVAPGR